MDDIISMADMALIYEVTDELGIDREMIRVELTKEDPGSIQRGTNATYEIVIPLSTPLKAWLPALKAALEKLV